MAFTEDMAVFFDTDDFAIAASYTPYGYPHTSVITSTVNGIFNYRYIESEGMQGEKPVFSIDETDIDDLTQGDQITINNTIYTIVDWEPSGDGEVMLILKENDT